MAMVNLAAYLAGPTALKHCRLPLLLLSLLLANRFGGLMFEASDSWQTINTHASDSKQYNLVHVSGRNVTMGLVNNNGSLAQGLGLPPA